MTKQEIATIKNLESLVKSRFENEYSGHDFFHTKRVTNTAVYIAELEKADIFTVIIVALLHDVDDRKISTDTWRNNNIARSYLKTLGFSENKISQIIETINEVSYKGCSSTPATIEGKCVQDADRLDALGAIGIARTFEYGGNMNKRMFDPNEKPCIYENEDSYYKNNSTIINHFYEKLLLLQNFMNTNSAKKIAAQRSLYMKQFLDTFYQEWEWGMTNRY